VKKHNQIPLALLVGAISGAFVLGIAGRFVMAGVALFTNNNPNLSNSGFWEVILLGTYIGIVGGVLLLLIKKIFPRWGLLNGIVIGVILFICSWFISNVASKTELTTYTSRWLTFIAVAFVYIIFGIIINAIFTRAKAVLNQT
jgi:hypothetical protein